ncbi:ell-associated factor Eaf-like [Dermacentor albipictus]|uniref:ell-associated factor Eaf-like n=1 Tax=Dermacentor albipictus TaxID=60249 RepID=UPI0031FCFC12
MPSPLEDHTCQPKCGFCGGPHVTSSRECHQRLKPARSNKPQEQQKRHVSRKDASQTKNRQRWFSSEDQDGSTQHRNVADTRSASRKRAASKQRNESATRSHAPNQSKVTANTGSREQQPPQRPITPPRLTQQHDTQLASKQKQAPQVPGGANHSTLSHRSPQQGPRPTEQEQDERVSWSERLKQRTPLADPRVPQLQAMIAKQNKQLAEQSATIARMQAQLEQFKQSRSTNTQSEQIPVPQAPQPTQRNDNFEATITPEVIQLLHHKTEHAVQIHKVQNVAEMHQAIRESEEQMMQHMKQLIQELHSHLNRKRGANTEAGPSKMRHRTDSLGSETSYASASTFA